MDEGFQIFYDGECPFCSAYMRMINLQRAVGRVELIDARSDDPRVQTLRQSGYDLDEGIVVRHGAQVLHGADAMHLLATLSERRGILRALMRSPRRAAMLYPVLKAGRRLTLTLMGRGRLR